MIAMPAPETAMPAYWARPGRSPSIAKAKIVVKKTWDWSRRELSPAGMPNSMPKNSSDIWIVPWVRPMPTVQYQAIAGGRKRISTGSAAVATRRPATMSGGRASSSSRMTTKEKPQRPVTARASAMWAMDMAIGSKCNAGGPGSGQGPKRRG